MVEEGVLDDYKDVSLNKNTPQIFFAGWLMGMMLWGVKGKLSVQVILAQPGTILVTGIYW